MERGDIDRLDRRILHGLSIRPRASYRDLAEAIGTSDQTVARRYRAMKAEIGLAVTGRLAEDLLGWNRWVVRIQATPDAAVPLAEALAARPDTMWVRLASGGTEITCGVQTRSHVNRSTLLFDRLTGARRVVGISAHLMLNTFSPTTWSWLSNALTRDEVAALMPPAPETLTEPSLGMVPWDSAHEALVQLLQADGRASAAHLADATGWHESTVRRRINQLAESGVLQFDIDLDEDAIGMGVSAQLWLAIDPGALDTTGREIARHPEAPFVAACTGPANLVAGVACRDSAHLYHYLTDKLGQIPAIRSIETVPVVRTYKRTASTSRQS